MVQSALDRLDPGRRETALQLVRYALAGGAITVAVAGSYWALAEFGGIDPNLSLGIVFVFFSIVSYVVHGAFSFRGHGTRDRHHVRGPRFLAVNVLGFAVNQFFVWLLVKQMGGPTWWPTIPIILVTPLLTFALHRRYVYA
jgi:putative flippase GtrA